MRITDTQELHADLSNDLKEFWEYFTGVRPTQVRVVVGERAIVVLLDEVLSPAEKHLASSETGRRMLQELGERLMEQASPQLQSTVDQAIEEKSKLVTLHLDVVSRTVLAFFGLE
jgi:uncharacterized protein YbcI